MKKPNITAGPWEMMRFLNDDESIASITIDSGDEATKIIASLYNEDLYEDELVANAQAISAVPEMIDALIEAYDALDNVKQDYSKRQLRSYKVNNSLAKMESALEKAGAEI